ncbi:MAG: hypothetical protein V4662_07495 [Verrucomicrobiota bacterium]
MKFPAPQPHCLLEALEPRLAPAGIVTVTVSGGALSLSGDMEANVVKIASPTANIWRLEDPTAGPQPAAQDTLFKFAGQPDSAAVRKLDLPTFTGGLKVVLNGGNDKLTMENLFTNGVVTLQGGEGDDEMFISGSLNGAVTLDGGNGKDDLRIAGFINGLVTLKAGAGDDKVFFGSGNYTKGLTVDLGAGTNEFTMYTTSSLNVFGNVNVTAAGAALNEQTFYLGIQSGMITGNVSLKSAAGKALYFFGGDSTQSLSINGGLSLTGSAGEDTVLFAGKLSVGGALTANLGAGINGMFNGIDRNNDDATRLVKISLGSLSYTGGAGNDSIYLDCPEVIIGGNVTATMGAGRNALGFFNSTGALIGGSLTYMGGSGDDRLDFGGSDTTIGGKLTFKGAGAQSLDPDATNTDSVYVYTAYAALHSVELVGGSTGKDVFYIGAADETSSTLISILGDLVTNTGAGFSDVRLTDFIAHGKVTHTSAVAMVGSVIHNDLFLMEDGYVQGAVSVNVGGSAKGEVLIDDSICVSTVTIATGAGDDRVDFDTDSTNSLGISVFYGAVSIILGAGNDDWYAGANPVTDTVGNQFKSSVKVDGGAGNNRSFYGYSTPRNNTFAYNPVFVGVMSYDPQT